MVSPGGNGEIDYFGMRVMASKEGTTNTECASPRDGLGNSDLHFQNHERQTG